MQNFLKTPEQPANLNCVARLWGDALHGEDDLEGVVSNVPGTHVV